MLLLSYSGVQLEVAKRTVLAARREELGGRNYRGSCEAAQISKSLSGAGCLSEEVFHLGAGFQKISEVLHHLPRGSLDINWLVVWNINFIFPYIGNNHPN